MDHAVIYAIMGEDGYNVFLHSALWSVQSLLMRTDVVKRGVPVYILAEKEYQDEIYKRTDVVGMPREWILFFEEHVPIPTDGRRILKRLEIGKYVSDFIDNEPVLSMWICMQKLSFLPIGTLIPFTGNYKRAKEQSLIFHTFNQDNMPIDFMELLLEGL